MGGRRRLFDRAHRDRHMELVVGSAMNHATHGRHVGVVAADGDGDVVLSGRAVVGRVEVGPLAGRARLAGQVDRNPGVRGRFGRLCPASTGVVWDVVSSGGCVMRFAPGTVNGG